MPPAPHFLIATALAVLVLILGSPPARANQPVYTYAYTGLDGDGNQSIDDSVESWSYLTSGAHAELTSQQGSSARATTDFGQNRAYAKAVNPSGGSEQIGALSMWSDQFTISGGTGSGTAQVSAALSGSLAEADYSVYVYALLKSEDPLLPGDLFAFLPFSIPPAGSSLLLGAYADSRMASGPVHIVLGNSFDFTYDSPFFLTGVLAVGANANGAVDFSNTAVFGLTVGSGEQVNTVSGTAYESVQAVPEAQTWAMLLAGLGLLGLRLRRR